MWSFNFQISIFFFGMDLTRDSGELQNFVDHVPLTTITAVENHNRTEIAQATIERSPSESRNNSSAKRKFDGAEYQTSSNIREPCSNIKICERQLLNDEETISRPLSKQRSTPNEAQVGFDVFYGLTDHKLAQCCSESPMFKYSYNINTLYPCVDRKNEFMILMNTLLDATERRIGGSIHLFGAPCFDLTTVVQRTMNLHLHNIPSIDVNLIRKYVMVFIDGENVVEEKFYLLLCWQIGWLNKQEMLKWTEDDAAAMFKARCLGHVKARERNLFETHGLVSRPPIFDDAPMLIVTLDKLTSIPEKISDTLLSLCEMSGSRLLLIITSFASEVENIPERYMRNTVHFPDTPNEGNVFTRDPGSSFICDVDKKRMMTRFPEKGIHFHLY